MIVHVNIGKAWTNKKKFLHEIYSINVYHLLRLYKYSVQSIIIFLFTWRCFLTFLMVITGQIIAQITSFLYGLRYFKQLAEWLMTVGTRQSGAERELDQQRQLFREIRTRVGAISYHVSNTCDYLFYGEFHPGERYMNINMQLICYSRHLIVRKINKERFKTFVSQSTFLCGCKNALSSTR